MLRGPRDAKRSEPLLRYGRSRQRCTGAHLACCVLHLKERGVQGLCDADAIRGSWRTSLQHRLRRGVAEASGGSADSRVARIAHSKRDDAAAVGAVARDVGDHDTDEHDVAARCGVDDSSAAQRNCPLLLRRLIIPCTCARPRAVEAVGARATRGRGVVRVAQLFHRGGDARTGEEALNRGLRVAQAMRDVEARGAPRSPHERGCHCAGERLEDDVVARPLCVVGCRAAERVSEDAVPRVAADAHYDGEEDGHPGGRCVGGVRE